MYAITPVDNNAIIPAIVFAVPVWSGVNIAGVRLRDLNPLVGTAEDPEKYNEMHKEVVNRYCYVCCFLVVSLIF